MITLTWIPELRSCCNAVSGPISSEPIRWLVTSTATNCCSAPSARISSVTALPALTIRS
ncbi:Uncharacterised protein [Vibrio cholerae]|nr:Uncharacterised protein [Vibrio cholerae]